jgi:hypothetical protein
MVNGQYVALASGTYTLWVLRLGLFPMLLWGHQSPSRDHKVYMKPPRQMGDSRQPELQWSVSVLYYSYTYLHTFIHTHILSVGRTLRVLCPVTVTHYPYEVNWSYSLSTMSCDLHLPIYTSIHTHIYTSHTHIYTHPYEVNWSYSLSTMSCDLHLPIYIKGGDWAYL